MTTLAALAAVRRAKHGFRGVFVVALGAISLASASILGFGLVAVVGHRPWWAPQYAIPLLGMLLGNALTGISLGLDRYLGSLLQRRDEVEMLLGHGATAREAAAEIRADAVRVGMIPILNSMAVVGTVSLPGMMTGQILSGTSPAVAVGYQIAILFLIAAATGLGTVLTVAGSERRLFGDRDRLLAERIT